MLRFGKALVLVLVAAGCRRSPDPGLQSPEPEPIAATAGPEASLSPSTSSALDIPTAAPQGAHPRVLLNAAALGSLRRRARENSPEWQALRARCDALTLARIEWPDGNDYPNAPNVGEGYQGEGYFEPLVSLGLCYAVTLAKPYAVRGADLLVKMSEPSGPHAVDPLRDSGFGIRFYGVGLALGFDWFYGALAAEQRARIVAALDRWIDAYEKKGFGRDHPQGNYFAGYYAAKGLAALATEGDDPKAPARWADWLSRVHGRMVEPYYAAHLAGGGWPEGWNYGPLATLNMIWPAWAAHTAKGIDLVHGAKPYAFPVDQAKHLIYFTWPSKRTIDDRAIQYASDNPSAARPGLFVTLAGLLEYERDPLAPMFHRYARDVLAQASAKPEAWQAFLFWNPSAKEADYRTLPLGFRTDGMQTAAVRSSWDANAVWASFTSGPYVNNPDSGEMYFDQGSLVVVRGDRELLVNAAGALQRNTPGTNDGDRLHDLIYDDLYGNNDRDRTRGNRTIFNVFYAKASRYGQGAFGPDQAKTRLARFEDGGAYVLMRGERLEDMYMKPKDGARPVAEWTRQVVYVRPGLFVVDDRTKTSDAAATDQWLAWHVAGKPMKVAGGERFEVAAGGSFNGVLTSVFPRGATTKTLDLFGRGKVFRVEVRPPSPAKEQRWLTVFDAAARSQDAARATPLSREDGSVQAGDAFGVALRGPSASVVVLASRAAPPLHGPIRYRIAGGGGRHVLTDLAPGATYSISVAPAGSGQDVTVTPGAGPGKASDAGVLTFSLSASGAVSP